MANNEAKIKFTAETGEFNKAIKQANDEMSELRAELKLNETQMKGTGASVEALEKQHGLLESQLKASQSKTEALTAKVEKAVEIYGENSTEVTKLKVQLTNAQTAEEKIRQAIDKCNQEIEEQARAAEEAQSATVKLTDKIEAQQSELQQLKGEYVKAVLEFGKGSKEAKSLAKQIDTLSGELKKNQTEMNNAESAADKLDNSLEKVDQTADQLSEGFTVMKGALANLVADGIQTATGALADLATEAFTSANDIDKAVNTYITQTGASAEAAEEFEDVMVSIYNNNFGENFEDIAAAMSTVKNNMGDIDGGELQKLTEGAILLRDTFEFEVGESTRAASMMMKQFGIDANTAYSLIATGAQNGLNKNGDLMDVINEYSVHFSQLGLSADDMFKMLAGGAETGVFSVDKLGDALKEFGIRAKDGSDSSREAFEYLGYDADEMFATFNKGGEEAAKMTKTVMDKLASMPDGVEKTTAGVALFGTMWEDLGATAIGALSGVDSELDTTKDTLAEINDVKYDDLGSALEGIKRNLTTAVSEPINDEVLPVLNDFVSGVDWQGFGQMAGEAVGAIVKGMFSLVEAASSAVGWMKEHQGLVIAIASVIGVLVTAITAYNVVQGIKNAMDAANVTTVWALVSAHIAQAAAAMAAIAPYVLIVAAIAAVIAIVVICIKYWDEIVAAVKRCWNAVCETLSGWGEWINTNVIQPIVGFFKGIWDGIVGVFQACIDWVKTNWKSIVLFIINPFAGIFNYLYTNFEGFRNFVNNIVENIKQFFVNLWNGIVNTFNSCVESIRQFGASVKQVFVNLWNGIVSAFHTVIDPWIEIIRRAAALCNEQIIQPIKNFFVDLWNSIVSGLQTAWNWCVSVCSTVANWVNANVIQPVINFFVYFYNFVVNGVRNAWNLCVSVCSTIANWVNTNIVQPVKNFFVGLWNGIKSGVQNAVSTLKSVFATISNWVSTKVIQPVQNLFSKLWTGFKDGAKKAWEGVKSVFSKVGQFFGNCFAVVKDKILSVFSAGGKIFSGIKDGIVSTFKTVVNAIIKGINKVITIPFNGLNTILDKIHGIEILGVSPFAWLTWRAPVPQIPLLAQGAYVGANSPMLAVIGDNKREGEFVAPESKLSQAVGDAVDRAMSAFNIGVLAAAIEDLANRPIELDINGRQFALATAGDSDRVNGFRNRIVERGVLLD